MIDRRQFVRAASTVTVTAALPRAAFALDFPTRQVRVVNPTAPGGTNDVVARLVSQYLTDKIGQTFLVDDRPGAGSNIAADIVARAPADGYTLLAMSKGAVLANLLYKDPGFDFMRDFTGVTPAILAPLIVLAHPSVPAKTMGEFIAYAKANPGKLNYGSAGVGSDPHLGGELLKQMADIDMTHVPFRGGALALTDLLAGGIHMMMSNLPVNDYIRDGRLRALAVTTAKRAPALPDIPAVAETVPGYDNGLWIGFAIRKGTPADIIDKLNKEIVAGLADPKVLEGLKVLNAAPYPMTPDEMNKMFATDIERWGKVIKAAKIQPE